MKIWQVDLFRRPLQDELKRPLWELVICNPDKTFAAYGFCPQALVNGDWVVQQLQELANTSDLPGTIEVFRPQCLRLLQLAGDRIKIPVIPTRRTLALKQYLQERAQIYPTLPQYTGEAYDPLDIELAPPNPIPDTLWGDRWRFAFMSAGDLDPFFRDKPIPVVNIPSTLHPTTLNLASTTALPGIVLDGGRQSMRLVHWIQQQKPVALNYVAGAPDGLILDVGLCDRIILTTFEDAEVRSAAITYQQRLKESHGLHFLLIQPDDSGMTYSGFWLLRGED